MTSSRHTRKPSPLPPSRPVSAQVDGSAVEGGFDSAAGVRVGSGEMDWIDQYLRVIYRHRLAAALVLGATVAGALVFVLTATPIFEARTELLIEVEGADAVQLRDSVTREQMTTDDYQTEYAIIRSRSIARRTIDRLKLWEHPEFAADRDSPRASSIVGRASTPTAEAEQPGAEESAHQTRVINRFLASLSVDPVTNSRLVDVRFRSADPTLAKDVVNTLADTYINQNVETRFQASKKAAEWLEEQLSEQRDRLEKGQQSLQRYREQNNSGPIEGTLSIVAQKLADLNAAVTRAETERIEKQAAFERLKAIQDDQAALDTFPAIQSSAFIQSLKSELAGLQRQRQELAQRLGDRHPDMVKLDTSIGSAEARLRSEVGKVVHAVENEYLAAQSQQQRLLSELAAQQREVLLADRRALDYGVLQREVASNQQLFDSLLQKAKEIGITGEFRSTNVRVVDQAEAPQQPVWPRTLPTLMGSFVMGTLLALGLAFGLERFDSRIKSPQEIPARLGLPYLGLVPELSSPNGEAASLLVSDGAPPNLVNAFEDLAANVMIMSNPDEPRIVLVCSAGPGDGKTMVASNLAISIAELGQRVVLIDVDMRRPRVNELFELEKVPGLTDLLAGEAKASEAVRRSKVPGLWVLTAGQTPENSAAFLGSGPYFQQLLRDFAGRFDWIVIDSPPVLAVADSTLIVQDVAGVVFVVNAKTTARNAAVVAIERLDASGAKFFGAVLNRADLERHGYYFDPYYRKEYGAYYGRQGAAHGASAPAAGVEGTLASINGSTPAEEAVTNGSGTAKRRRRSSKRIRPPASRAYLAERDNW